MASSMFYLVDLEEHVRSRLYAPSQSQALRSVLGVLIKLSFYETMFCHALNPVEERL